VVLIVVIGVLAVLSLIAATFGMLMSVEVAASRNQTEHEMARQAAHSGAEYLIARLADYQATGGMTSGTLPVFCPAGDDEGVNPFGCRQLFVRDGVKVYFSVHEHPSDEPWTVGLGNEDAGMFNINAMGFLNDLGSNANPDIRYTSFETSLVRLIESRFGAYAGTATGPGPGLNTLEDSARQWRRGDDLDGKELFIVAGTGSGQSGIIQDFDESTPTVVTVDSNWVTPPDSTSVYVISTDSSNRITEVASNVYSSFANDPDERRRIAILLARAIILGRQAGGTDIVPGSEWVEEKRLGHLPRWNATLGWDPDDLAAYDVGVGYPDPTFNDKFELGWDDGLPSTFLRRTLDLNDTWSYTEPGDVWLSNTGGAATGTWNDDKGVSSSAITWGKIALVGDLDPVTVDPPYEAFTGQIFADTTAPGWMDWQPVNRWVDAVNHYYLYIATGTAKGWYEITASDANSVTLLAASYGSWTADPDVLAPKVGDSFCIVHAESGLTFPRNAVPGGQLDRRWDNAATDVGDLVPTANYWPDGTLTTEAGVYDLVRESGVVTGAENKIGATYAYLDDASKNWATVDQWVGYVVHIYKGAGIGQVRQIRESSANRLTIETDWTTPPDTSSSYYIEYYDENLPSKYRPDNLQGNDQLYMSLGTLRDSILVPAIEYDIAPTEQKGRVTSAGANTLDCADAQGIAQTWVDDWTGKIVRIAAGKGYGQEATIVSNTASQLNILLNGYDPDTNPGRSWVIIPDTSSRYYIRTDAAPFPLLTSNARAIMDILLPEFQKYLSVSTRSLQANQELAGINDWQVDGIDNDKDGIIDNENPTVDDDAEKAYVLRLYDSLGLRTWAAGVDDDEHEARVKRAAQLLANIIDFRDDDHVPLKLTRADLHEDDADDFTVYGAEGLHVTEIMASPDADYCTGDPAVEMTNDGNSGDLDDGFFWDWIPGPGPGADAFRQYDATYPPTQPADVTWIFENAATGHYAVRLIGTIPAGEKFRLIVGGVNYETEPTYLDPEDNNFNYGFPRDPAGKLLHVDLSSGNTFVFQLLAPQGAIFRGLALLPQYIEITNVAANDIRMDELIITTDAGTINLSTATTMDTWRQLIRGATADGLFPVNYGTYVIAMSEEAYERQWSPASGGSYDWGDAAGEDYPVFFAGDESDALAQALLMGAYNGTTRAPSVKITNSDGDLIAGYDVTAGNGVDGSLADMGDGSDAYSSIEKKVILQPTWDIGTAGDYWEHYHEDTDALSGSQNVEMTAQGDSPRPPSIDTMFYSNLNHAYSDLIDAWPGFTLPPQGTLNTGTVLADAGRVYPIILNRPYPTIGWLGLVPTSNEPWRTVDPIHAGDISNVGNIPGLELQPWIQDAAASWTEGTYDSPVGQKIKIIASDGLGQVRTVVGVKGTDPSILYLDRDWDTLPNTVNGRYIFLDPVKPEELLGSLMRKAATGGIYARFNINTALIDVLKSVFEDGQSKLIDDERGLLADHFWASWDELLNDPIFRNAPDPVLSSPNMFEGPDAMGFFDNPGNDPSKQANEDSGAGTYADDFMDDSDENEEWARRFANLFDLRSTAFRFIVAGFAYREQADIGEAPVAEVRIEMDVDLSDPSKGPVVNHFRYLSQ
jgi:hypothetical protein